MCSDADPLLSHPVEAMFDGQTNPTTLSFSADLSTWWQSVTWYELGRRPTVTITLSFGKTLQFQDDLVAVFESARPQQMVLEKSVDFGQTWTPLQYYNRNCGYVSILRPYFFENGKVLNGAVTGKGSRPSEFSTVRKLSENFIFVKKTAVP